jgi:uncharacterized membrane protein
VSERAARRAVAALALVGLGIAAYLAATRAAGAAPVCATGGCETVQSSEYAEVLGIPVAVLGVVAYAVLVATALVGSSAPVAVGAAVVGAAVAVAGAVFSLYLVYLQVAVIDAVCMWCVVSDVLMVVLAGLALVRLRALVAETPA